MLTTVYGDSLYHNSDVIMNVMASQTTGVSIVYSTVCSGVDKKHIKAPRHWPLWGEFTGDGEFPAQRASNAENVSIDDVNMIWMGPNQDPGMMVIYGH